MDAPTVGRALETAWKHRTTLWSVVRTFPSEWAQVLREQREDTADLIRFWTEDVHATPTDSPDKPDTP